MKCHTCGKEPLKSWHGEAHEVKANPPIVYCLEHGELLGKWAYFKEKKSS